MLGRAAAALAGVHGVRPGDRAVVVVRTDEGLEHLRTVIDAGVEVVATAVSAELADRLPEGVGEVVLDGEVHEARGGASLRSVVLRRDGRGKRFDCDVLVLSLGFAPRDGLARMALPSEAVSVVGDAALRPDVTGACGHEGTVCLCEDVSMHDLEQAWDEGYRNAEILKRYTTTTMGPCQGAMCGRALSCFAAERAGRDGGAGERRAPHHRAAPDQAGHPGDARRRRARDRRQTNVAPRCPCGRGRTARSLGRVAAPVQLRRLARGVPRGARAGEPDGRRHAGQVHDRRPRRRRPGRPRVPVPHRRPAGGSHAIRAHAGRGRVRDGRRAARSHRGGGVVPHLDLGRRRADRRPVAELRRPVRPRRARAGSHGAMGRDQRRRAVCAGPARTAHRRPDRCGPCPIRASPTSRWRACRVVRSAAGSSGSSRSNCTIPVGAVPSCGRALADAGREWDLRPHGLDALELLRLEKGHIYLGQDTMPDDTPAKLGHVVGGRYVEAVVRGQAGARAHGRAADVATPCGARVHAAGPRTSPSCAGNRCWWGARWSVASRRPSARSRWTGRSASDGCERSTMASPSGSRRGPARRRGSCRTPFYDPDGGRMRG